MFALFLSLDLSRFVIILKGKNFSTIFFGNNSSD